MGVMDLTLGAKCFNKVPIIIKSNIYSGLRWIHRHTRRLIHEHKLRSG